MSRYDFLVFYHLKNVHLIPSQLTSAQVRSGQVRSGQVRSGNSPHPIHMLFNDDRQMKSHIIIYIYIYNKEITI